MNCGSKLGSIGAIAGNEQLISVFLLIHSQERTEKQNIKDALGMTLLTVWTLWAKQPQKCTLVKKTIRV